MARQTPRRYLIVEATPDGQGVQVHEMKKWLRLHPEELPEGMSAETVGDNSQMLRRGLIRAGWSVHETDSEVRLSRSGDAVLADDLMGGSGAPTNEESDTESFDENEETDQTFFRLERQLQLFVADNISLIPVNGKRLRLYSDAKSSGIEYQISNRRRIDILAQDEEGNFVVFEFKRKQTPDEVIGQLTNYMGWVSLHLARGKAVSGVIVAQSISNNLRESIVVVPNVLLFEYRIKFDLNQVDAAQTIEAVEQ